MQNNNFYSSENDKFILISVKYRHLCESGAMTGEVKIRKIY